MKLTMNTALVIAIPCPHCGRIQGPHKPGCLQTQLLELCTKRRHHSCPLCDKNAVDVNNNDYWECRECCAQFRNGKLDVSRLSSKDGKQHMIIDFNEDCVYPVLLLSRKGRGNFPIDRAIRKIECKIERKANKQEGK